MSTTTIQIRSKGVITLPKDLRRQYRLNEGDILTLVDLGDGFFLLTPPHLPTARLADEVGQVLGEAGVTLDDLLQTLDEERERYYQEQLCAQLTFFWTAAPSLPELSPPPVLPGLCCSCPRPAWSPSQSRSK